jgi:hypothetical protein
MQNWPWFWAEAALKAWQDLATLHRVQSGAAVVNQCCQVAAVTATFLKCGSF